MRQQLLDAIYDGRPFRTVLRDLGFSSNQVWGMAKTDQEWSEMLETALTAARRNDLEHAAAAAYKHGCVCRECREHQQRSHPAWLEDFRALRKSPSVLLEGPDADRNVGRLRPSNRSFSLSTIGC
jgi:hypothetical protein